MGKIVLLDDATINKIAAGEVVERPASVVKEIVENSIDAGATNITIEIKNGGISYIRVTDNGKGIMQDDMEIAFERHATSKLRNADDLNEIKSMGFRGEALASIAAISKVELVSKTRDSDNGYMITVEGGRILQKEEVGCQNGTTITIENLFFNTPVRYKFLKKDFTESGYIEDIVARMALIHPEIAIKLINTGKTIIQTSGNGDLQAVIYNIYGKDVAENLINIQYQYEDIKISGVVGKPVISRSNRTNQIFFVNQRYIKDKTLTGAADQAFKGFVTIGKHGFLILNIEINPQKVDVNVHPTKLEIRFQDENTVFKAVYHAIKDGLLRNDLVATTSSIDGINESKKDVENAEDKETTSFRDVAKAFEYKNTTDADKIENKESDLKYTKEKITEKNFDDVVSKLLEMQNMVNIAKGERTVTAEEIKEKLNTFTNTNSQEKFENQSDIKIDNSTTDTIESGIDVAPSMGIIESGVENSEVKENYYVERVEQQQNANNITETDNIEINNTEIKKTEEKNEEEEELKVEIQIEPETVTAGENEIENTVKIESQDETDKEQEVKTENETEPVIKAEEKKDKEQSEDSKISDEEFLNLYEKMFGKIRNSTSNNDINNDAENVADELKPITKDSNFSVFEESEQYKNQLPYKFIGIAFKTYIIVQIENDLYIIDQHAAHERIMYEKVKKNYYSETEKDSQLMLWPDIITLTHKEMGIYKDNREMFEKAGFMVEEFGENTLKLSGVPAILLDLETKELFLETLDEINTVARTAKQDIEEKFIATIACKAAVKAHMALNKEEVENLMDKLLKLPNPFTCPHGRPTAIKMTKYEIEKKFSRIQ